MKTILITTMVLASAPSFAQEKPFIPKERPFIHRDLLQKMSKGQAVSGPNYQKEPPYYFTIPDSSKKESVVVSLPQDGMPCIVPDMRKFNNMPNAAKPEDLSSLDRKPGAIPNPLLRKPKPKVKPFIKPDTNKEGS